VNSTQLIKKSDSIFTSVREESSHEIQKVTHDSRKADSNSLFVAIKGFKTDGHSYIEAAYQSGCRNFLVESGRENVCDSCTDINLFSSSDTRLALSKSASVVYGEVSKKIPVIGVTGTNGKTSITYMIESVLKEAGFIPGVIGTVNYRWDDTVLPAPNTTPESSELHSLLAQMYSDGVDVIVMEVSSHALSLGRVDDIHFSIALFTNLTQDHLDFHKDFDEYYAAKKKLFQQLQKSDSSSGIKKAIINTDDEYGARLFDELSQDGDNPAALSSRAGTMYHIIKNSIDTRLDGISYSFEIGSSSVYDLDLHMSARFNVYNSAMAFAACHALGVEEDIIVDGLSGMTHVPGRFDRVSSDLGFHVIIDYAHTDDALRKLLNSARELNPNSLITVFGCGGDRDRKKRPLMGKAAVSLSDKTIVTSDNPRTEKPEDIISDILAGIDNSDGAYQVIQDRKEAIKVAVFQAEEGDLVVIAGKGHEDYQILGTEKIHFDDKELVEEFIQERESQ
jgi:UDP-N-acetylmuramoyl-L-alanyl-D-glutamate--2,6-diaminopimelate ligase